MKQPTAPQKSSTVPSVDVSRNRRAVVMGQGIITPAVREHLAKSAKAARALPKAEQSR